MKQGPALRFAEELAALDMPYFLRYVYIPGYTDDPRDIDKLIEFAKVGKLVAAVGRHGGGAGAAAAGGGEEGDLPCCSS